MSKLALRKRVLLTIVAILVASSAMTWVSNRYSPPASKPATNASTPLQSHPLATASAAQPNSNLLDHVSKFNNVINPQTARTALADLRAALAAMPPAEAVAAVQKVLNSRVDVPTRLGFKVASSGLLDEAPTLRTFLLDEMARLDPIAAANYAKVVLASMDSPDEWAVALRNLARGDVSAEGRAYLEQKTGELLRSDPWQENPSVGFLEAFDVAVHLGRTNLLPDLLNLVRRQDNPAVARASFLALDRLTINDPVSALTFFAGDPGLMQGREETRANYFARADVGDPAQRALVETYLLAADHTEKELRAFAGIFPNANFMISHNLLTVPTTLDGAQLARRDAETRRIIESWKSDTRFERLRPYLYVIQRRLEVFPEDTTGK